MASSGANLEVIKQTTIERSKGIIASQVAMSFSELQNQANLFLQDILTIYHAGETERVHKGNSEIMRLWSLYRDAKTSQALALAKNSFSLALDNYLQRTIILTYVSKDGRVLLYTEEGEIEILNQVSKQKGRENFKAGAWEGTAKGSKVPQQYSMFGDDKENELARMIAESAAKRKEIYAEGVRRYDYLMKGNKKRPDSERRRYYYEFHPNVWTFPETSFSKGEMAEAYVNAVVEDQYMTGNVETGLQELYEHYILGHKDNIGAIVKGDVVLDESMGNVTLAVKGQSASTAKIGQYIVAADQIRKMAAPPPEGIQKWLENLPNINSYAKEVEAAAEEDAQKIAFEEILANSFS